MADTETRVQQATTENGGTVAGGLAPEGTASRVHQVFFRKWLAKAKAVYNSKTVAAGLPCIPAHRQNPYRQNELSPYRCSR